MNKDTIRDVEAINNRELYDNYTRNEPDQALVAEYRNYYMNWPKEDAPAYLNCILQRYQDAEWIPDYSDGIFIVDTDAEVSHRTPRA